MWFMACFMLVSWILFMNTGRDNVSLQPWFMLTTFCGDDAHGWIDSWKRDKFHIHSGRARIFSRKWSESVTLIIYSLESTFSIMANTELVIYFGPNISMEPFMICKLFCGAILHASFSIDFSSARGPICVYQLVLPLHPPRFPSFSDVSTFLCPCVLPNLPELR